VHYIVCGTANKVDSRSRAVARYSASAQIISRTPVSSVASTSLQSTLAVEALGLAVPVSRV